MECIGCANCIDACDDVMARIGKPRGLVRYDSQRGFAGGRDAAAARPRVVIYAALGLLGAGGLRASAGGREPFQANVPCASTGLPYLIEGARIRNLYTLHLQNKSDAARPLPHRARAGRAGRAQLHHPAAGAAPRRPGGRQVPLFVMLPRADYTSAFDFDLLVTELESGNQRRLALRFRGP